MNDQLPLYLMAQNKCLPDHQFMDVSTLEWIKSNKPEFENTDIIKIDPLVIINKYISRYAPPEEWFLNSSVISTIHGERHILRCLVLAGILSETNQLSSDIRELCLVCSLHDLRRENDKEDFGHAERAASWVKENFESIIGKFELGINEVSLERIIQAILFHDKKDYFMILDLSVINLVNDFKLIDALDRYRQPKMKWWINDEYLQIKPSSAIKNFAFDLVIKSEEYFLSGLNNRQAVQKSLYDLL